MGVVLFSNSRRLVECEKAEEIFSSLGPFTTTVAVTHSNNEEEIEKILGLGPDAIQISNGLPIPGKVRVIRVAFPGNPVPNDCDAILVDASMGRGMLYDRYFAHGVIKRASVPVLLAGGLTPENVKEAIRSLHPYAVDVATGVEESPGIKNEKLIRTFIRYCREAENE